MTTVALTIAGSDPSGGAGIQADLKTFHQAGVYGMSVITLLTVQNTKSVQRVEVLSPELVLAQMDAVLEDIPPAAAKTGALGSSEVIAAVASRARGFKFPLVIDPVMISKHGAPLLDAGAQQILIDQLLPCAALVTPNLFEAESLSGLKYQGPESLRTMAVKIASYGPAAVLIKGGHLEGDAIDYLYQDGREHFFRSERVRTRHTHGTGCTFSAAITAGLANGGVLEDAVSRAKDFITAAIQTAPGIGGGVGPVNHKAFFPSGIPD